MYSNVQVPSINNYLKNAGGQGCYNQLESVCDDSLQASSKLHSKKGLSLDCKVLIYKLTCISIHFVAANKLGCIA